MGAKKFRKKPVEVEAMLYTGENNDEVIEWVSPNLGGPELRYILDLDSRQIIFPNLSKEIRLNAGEWIIKQSDGVFFHLDPVTFEATYGSIGDTVEKYDSTSDTLFHIKRVSQLLTLAAIELIHRSHVHDNSKLRSPEKEIFDEFTPKLKGSTYGSDEYKGFLAGMKVALDHHYANNSHHPEYYHAGVNGMNLFDLMEMFLDWQAATERHEDGDIMKSIRINQERFELSDQLAAIFRNTAQYLHFSSDEPV